MSDLAQMHGVPWPFVILVLAGVLPNEVWRVAAALLARRVDEGSDVFVLVRMVSTALVAAMVAKLLVHPPPALSDIPFWGRAGAPALAVAVFLASGRSMLFAVLAGVLWTIAASVFFETSLLRALG